MGAERGPVGKNGKSVEAFTGLLVLLGEYGESMDFRRSCRCSQLEGVGRVLRPMKNVIGGI